MLHLILTREQDPFTLSPTCSQTGVHQALGAEKRQRDLRTINMRQSRRVKVLKVFCMIRFLLFTFLCVFLTRSDTLTLSHVFAATWTNRHESPEQTPLPAPPPPAVPAPPSAPSPLPVIALSQWQRSIMQTLQHRWPRPSACSWSGLVGGVGTLLPAGRLHQRHVKDLGQGRPQPPQPIPSSSVADQGTNQSSLLQVGIFKL